MHDTQTLTLTRVFQYRYQCLVLEFMYVKKRPNNRHLAPVVSRRSVNRFIALGLRIIEATPVHYFHQTLTFPKLVTSSKQAKSRLMQFFKNVTKSYAHCELAIFYVQERRSNGGIHYHVCFLFLCEKNLPFSSSRMEREFRADIFRRWNALNGAECVHPANRLNEHKFDIGSLDYLAKVKVVATLSKRAETNWWGLHNKRVLYRRSTEPATLQIAALFEAIFRKSVGKYSAERAVKPSSCDQDGYQIGSLLPTEAPTACASSTGTVFPTCRTASPRTLDEILI